MSPLDWLILVLWMVTAVELVLEARKKRWGAAALSGFILAVLTWVALPIFRHLAGVVASWFSSSGTP